jgi:hypothetical protein
MPLDHRIDLDRVDAGSAPHARRELTSLPDPAPMIST